MNLSELMEAVGPTPIRPYHFAGNGTAEVTDVVLVDSAFPPAAGQVLLAVGVDSETAAAQKLMRAAEREGVAAVLFRAPADGSAPAGLQRTGPVSILLADAHLGWTQLLLLLRTLTSAVQDETATSPSDELAPSSMHGLADAIAAMVGGSVVLYDRAHRVIAYSVQGHEIDEVRRDTILGKRTPEQWIRRFTLDRSAYQTFLTPDSVVRVDKYPNLRTRLRIAIHAGDEILGEVSVAEGRHPLGADAEEALRRAAALAAPSMLRHRIAQDAERTARSRMLGGLIAADASYARDAQRAGLDPAQGLTIVGFAMHAEERTDPPAQEVLRERLVHLLSLQMSSIDPAAGVMSTAGAYYAVIPTHTEAAHDRLPSRLDPAMSQLRRLDIDARAAVGRRVTALAELPASRADVDDQLQILATCAEAGTIGTRKALWADLALLPAERAVTASDPELGAHLHRLIDHDTRHGTEFVKTLRVYLDTFGSTSAAAERLMLHPNSLRHRIARLADISEIDLEDPRHRLALALQLRALDRSGRESMSPT
jgi:hypothetical protein